MNLQLSEQQTQLQAEADDFASRVGHLLKDDPEYRLQGMPSDGDSVPLYQELGRANLIGINWPEDLGGRGLSHVDTVAVEERLGYAWLPLSSYLVSVKTVGNALLRCGSDELQRQVLPQIAAGDIVVCQGFSEPEAGSDLAGLRTRAVRRGDTLIVNGHKIWTSSAQIADWIYLGVRTSDAQRKHDGLTVLLAPMSTPGISVRTLPVLGGGVLGEVMLEDVEVPVDLVVGEIDRGWNVLMATLAYERVTSEKLGSVLWMLDTAERETGERFDDLRGEAAAARLLGYRAAWLLDRQDPAAAVASSMAKLSIALLGRKVARRVLDSLGPRGLFDCDPALPVHGRAAALLRAGVGSTVAGGAAEIQRLVIGRMGLVPR